MKKAAAALLFLALSCAHTDDQRVHLGSDLGALEQIRNEWASDWNNKRIDLILQLYESDAVFLRPTAERTSGISSIRELFQKVLETNTPQITFHAGTIETSGNLAYDSGTYEETIASGGTTRATRGDYLLILKRQTDGRWLIVQHAWTDYSGRG
jgi:uncharacterized protein (TIGR02246 family)